MAARTLSDVQLAAADRRGLASMSRGKMQSARQVCRDIGTSCYDAPSAEVPTQSLGSTAFGCNRWFGTAAHTLAARQQRVLVSANSTLPLRAAMPACPDHDPSRAECGDDHAEERDCDASGYTENTSGMQRKLRL